MSHPAYRHLRLLVLFVAFAGLSCAQLLEMQRAMTNLSRCKFKLDSIGSFELMGVGLSDKAKLSDFSLRDGARLAAAFVKGGLPASFTLNVAAVNPNDGTGGSTQAAATMTSFAWTLILDNTTTINGNIVDPIVIPGTGQQTIIPLKMDLDLAQFFKEKGYESVANLALALGGVGGSPARVTLKAKPTIKTDLGNITYPGEISIIDKEFRAQ
jgi:hypothetical protein